MTAPYWSNGVATLHQADARAIPLPDGSVHCCVTSPPYFGLRDYQLGDVGIGLEPTLSDWLANIVAVSREVWRVLRDDGTYWLNLGDSYSGSKQTGRNDVARMYGEPSQVAAIQTGKGVSDSSLPAKNLMGQPWRAAFALQDDGWILRSAIVWHKPNPMPESVSDRPTSAYEMVFLLTKRAHYFYDADAVREGNQRHKKHGLAMGQKDGAYVGLDSFDASNLYTVGRNARNVWQIPTQGRPEAHFATYPDELPRRCILAGTSEHGVCSDCGAPWQRETEKTYSNTIQGNAVGGRLTVPKRYTMAERKDLTTATVGWQPTCECGPCEYHRLLAAYRRAMATLEDVWSDADPPDLPQPPTGECTHPPRTPATVLDPFIGSGTTVAVAQQLGRHGIGLDLNPDYLSIAAKRLAGISLPMAI